MSEDQTGLKTKNFRTKRSEEDGGGDEEAEHQSHHDDARHDGTEPPPAHDQDDPTHDSDHRRHGQADCRERHSRPMKLPPGSPDHVT